MPLYQHLSPDSGIVSYECGPDWIDVRFRSGVRYKYSAASAGMHNIEAMQRLAEQGKGLSAYISAHVHDAYARKFEPRSDT
jgi:hypothetical protein